MSIVLEGLYKCTVAYSDDILIYSKTLDEHLGHIQEVFDRLKLHELKQNLRSVVCLKMKLNILVL